MTETRQKKNIYHLALSILEIGGLTRQQTHTLLMNAGLFYTGSLKSILEALEKRILNLTSENKELLRTMLDQDAKKRPTLKEILERIKASESSSKDIRKVIPQLEEKKISGPEQRNTRYNQMLTIWNK